MPPVHGRDRGIAGNPRMDVRKALRVGQPPVFAAFYPAPTGVRSASITLFSRFIVSFLGDFRGASS